MSVSLTNSSGAAAPSSSKQEPTAAAPSGDGHLNVEAAEYDEDYYGEDEEALYDDASDEGVDDDDDEEQIVFGDAAGSGAGYDDGGMLIAGGAGPLTRKRSTASGGANSEEGGGYPATGRTRGSMMISRTASKAALSRRNTLSATGAAAGALGRSGSHHVPSKAAAARAALAALPTDPIAAAETKWPKTFLKYDDHPYVVASEDLRDDPSLPAAITHQTAVLSQRPVVTSQESVLDAVLPPRHVTVVIRAPNTATQQQQTGRSTTTGSQSARGQNQQQQQPQYKAVTAIVAERTSRTQVPRGELRALSALVDVKLEEAKVRAGDTLCPVRRAIHSMLFDELLRQVTIECPERGLLLRRVRDEMTMTIDAYAALYAEGVDYSTNRGVSAFKHVPEMAASTARVEAEVKDLRTQLKKLEAKHAALARSVQVQREQAARRQDEERLFLARAQQRLEDQLAAVREAQEAQRRALRETD